MLNVSFGGIGSVFFAISEGLGGSFFAGFGFGGSGVGIGTTSSFFGVGCSASSGLGVDSLRASRDF